jgi:hypothetical protein
LPALVLVLTFIGFAPFPGFIVHSLNQLLIVMNLRELSILGSPQCVAGLGVGLDFHRSCSFPGFIVHSLDPLNGVLDLVEETRRLATPQCVAGLGVGLNLHWISPFFQNLFATLKLSWHALPIASAMPKRTAIQPDIADGFCIDRKRDSEDRVSTPPLMPSFERWRPNR